MLEQELSYEEYIEVLEAIDVAAQMVDRLEARPASAKRDVALAVLRRELARAVADLTRLPSASHRN